MRFLQTSAHNDLAVRVLTPLREAEAQAQAARAKRAAATKVDFFTMVRGGSVMDGLTPGFDQPATDAARAFRMVLDAIGASRPHKSRWMAPLRPRPVRKPPAWRC